MCAGIKLVVAESIERIYRENCQNLGVLTTTDFSLLDKVRRGEVIPLSAFTRARARSPAASSSTALVHSPTARLKGEVVLHRQTRSGR